MASLLSDAWFAVQVAPRSERRVASLLEYKGYQQFAPTYLSRKRWSDRIKTVEEPLFPGYVFVRSSGTAMGGLICATPGVIHILSFGGHPSPIPDSEIDCIRKFTQHGTPMPAQYLNVGQRVEIRDGPFAGIVGIVRQIRGRACLIVSVELISQSIYIDVDEYHLGPITIPPLAKCA